MSEVKETPKHVFIVQHYEHGLDPTGWCTLEYKHMAEALGFEGVLITNVTDEGDQKLMTSLNIPHTHHSILNYPDFLKNVKKSEICLLDLRGTKCLGPSDATEFKYFVFGGILGDHPPNDKGRDMREFGFPYRNLGEKQMTTDTAVIVSSYMIHDQIPMNSLKYSDYPTITISDFETTKLPFRYLANSDGEPRLPPGMKELFRTSLDQGLDIDTEANHDDIDEDALADMFDFAESEEEGEM